MGCFVLQRIKCLVMQSLDQVQRERHGKPKDNKSGDSLPKDSSA